MRLRAGRTILIRLQTAGCRTLKTFSLPPVCRQLPRACPALLSSPRCGEWAADARLALAPFLAPRAERFLCFLPLPC